MRFFVFATFFGVLSTNALAQGFFIPQGAMAPMTEKLKPLDDSLQKRAAPYSQRLYQVRDGRVIAIEDEKPAEPEGDSIAFEPKEVMLEQAPAPTQNKETSEVTKIEVVEEKPVVEAPQTAPVDLSLAPYKNRYALYLKDLEVFRRTKKMPSNEDLNATLSKAASPRQEVLFEGKVQ